MKKLLLQLVLLVSVTVAHAQSKSVTGKVTDVADGSSLAGVSIVIKGTTSGTITDADGKYAIDVDSNQTLVFSFVGFVTEEIPVGERSVINVNMTADITQLSDVVVTAFGIEKETKKLGYNVQTVDTDGLVQAADPNLGTALRGKMAGVNINSNAGGVGSSVSINVRGISSLGINNQPLLVLDGVIIDSNQGGQGDFASGIDYGNTLSNLNPNDIESVSVLKGGNATALYGFRGNNGVLVITTKRGKSEKPTVELSSTTNFSNVLVSPKLQNQYGQGFFSTDPKNPGLIYDITKGSSFGPKFDGTQKQRFDKQGTSVYSGTDNDFKSFFRTGVSLLNSIAISQGKDKYDYRLSYSRSDDESIVPSSKLTRQNFSIKAGLKITDWLRVTGKVDYIDQYAKNRPELTGGQSNLVRALSIRPRNISNSLLKNNPTKKDKTPNNWGGAFIMNPYYAINNTFNEDQTDRYISLLEFNADIVKGLKALVRLSQDQISKEQFIYNPLDAFSIAPKGKLTNTQIFSRTNNYDLILTHDREITDEIDLTLTAGASHSISAFKALTAIGETFLVPNFFSFKNFKSVTVEPNKAKSASNSLFGTLNIGYNDYIFAEFSARNDWSSTLPIENASFFYPSAGLSVILSDAIDGLQGSETISFLKLRGSYAQTGNATSPYALANTYNVSSNLFNGQRFFFFGNDEEGAGIGPALSNPRLKPEKSSTMEFGLDAHFMSSRIRLSATYYSIRTTDQILELSMPPTSGARSQRINAGLVTNKGIEISLYADPVKTDKFSWTTGVNITKNDNVVEELAQGVKKNLLIRQFNDVVQIAAEVGASPHAFFGSKIKRDKNGGIIYDEGGLPVKSDKIEKIGDANPDAFINWNNTLTYGPFSLGFLVDAKLGGQIFSMSEIQRHSQGTAIETLKNREYYSGGKGYLVPSGATIEKIVNKKPVEGTLNSTVKDRGVDPQSYWARMATISENWVYDATYVKLREVSVGYDIPNDLVSRIGLSSASISYVGRNLAILHSKTDNFDPETGFSTSYSGVEYFGIPSASSHGFRINITL